MATGNKEQMGYRSVKYSRQYLLNIPIYIISLESKYITSSFKQNTIKFIRRKKNIN